MLNKKCLFCCPYLKKEVKSHFWWGFWHLFLKILKFLANVFTSPTPPPLSLLTNGVGGHVCKGLAKTLIHILQFHVSLSIIRLTIGLFLMRSYSKSWNSKSWTMFSLFFLLISTISTNRHTVKLFTSFLHEQGN